ncbi:MAG: hypothetical protein NVS3B21_28450 [Acidimicrobiales bacterium]
MMWHRPPLLSFLGPRADWLAKRFAARSVGPNPSADLADLRDHIDLTLVEGAADPVGPRLRGSTRLCSDPDSLSAVMAHRAMNSMAVVTGTLDTLHELGEQVSPEDRDLLIARAIHHTHLVNALLHDLVVGLPLGATAEVEGRTTTAEQQNKISRWYRRA